MPKPTLAEARIANGRKLPYVLLLGALVLFALGVSLDEAEAVFEKAVTVCLSCIGIG